MSKLHFTPKPTSQDVENFIDFIEFNRSQRNKNKEFLMSQFERGAIFLENDTIVIRDMVNPDKTESEHIQRIIHQVVNTQMVLTQ